MRFAPEEQTLLITKMISQPPVLQHAGQRDICTRISLSHVNFKQLDSGGSRLSRERALL